MRNRIERLRLWLLAGAGLLVLVLAVFIGSARYLSHGFLFRKPANLGANIESAMSDFTYSHTSKSGTVYFIRAAKEEKHTDGKIALHDVKMMLYGPKQDRADRIYGNEFEYDTSAGVMRAIGLVHIDMQAAGAMAAGAAGHPLEQGAKLLDRGDDANEADPKVLHATTSGLVYIESLGVAATSQPIEFRVRGMTGHAVGADYNTDSGMLVLHSAVNMSGVAGGRPVTLEAASAELDNRNQVAFLTQAKYGSQGETAQADQATLHTRADGSLARIQAQGNVTSEAKGAKVVSAQADVTLNPKSQPKSAVLTGGVTYSRDEALRQMRGQGDAATIDFDAQAKPQPSHAVFSGSVHMIERTRATEAPKEPWSVRDLTAAKVEIAMTPGIGKSEVRDAEATGDAHLTEVKNGSLKSAHGQDRTELSADDLKAHFLAAANEKQSPQIDTVAGRGHTLLRQVSADDLEQASGGDSLDAKFRMIAPAAHAGPAAKTSRAGGKGAGEAPRQASDTLQSAVQTGHVTMMRRLPPRAAKPGTQAAPEDVQRGTAERAVYEGDLDRVTLTGSVQLADAGSVLWANQVGLDHKTGDAHAEGAVKVDYVQESSAPAQGTPVSAPVPAPKTASAEAPHETEPTHILADRAEMEHASDIARFYGKPVRMWQAGSQIQAPVIELWRAQRRLVAHGDASTGWSTNAQAPEVHTTLVKAAAASPPAVPKTPAKAGTAKSATSSQSSDVVKIASAGLIYSDILNQADFTGSVRVESAGQTIVAKEAVAYLHPRDGGSVAKSNPASDSGVSLDGRVDRVVATGGVTIDQPGLHATGERLAYTESDAISVLSGVPGTPAKVVTAQGTSTGAAFRFHAADATSQEKIEALGATDVEAEKGARGTNQRVHTESRVSKERKSGPTKN